MGHVPAGSFRQASQGDDVSRRQRRRAGAVGPDLSGSYRRSLGRFGEAVAADYLRRRGLTILGQNRIFSGTEVDLVAEHGPQRMLVEVKTIVGREDGHDPVDQLEPRQLGRLQRLRQRFERPVPRIDVIGVTVTRRGVDIRWWRDW